MKWFLDISIYIKLFVFWVNNCIIIRVKSIEFKKQYNSMLRSRFFTPLNGDQLRQIQFFRAVRYVVYRNRFRCFRIDYSVKLEFIGFSNSLIKILKK